MLTNLEKSFWLELILVNISYTKFITYKVYGFFNPLNASLKT